MVRERVKAKQFTKWKPIYLVQIYRMVKAGMPERDIWTFLDISEKTLWDWKKKFPELEEAVAMARKERDEQDKFPSWIYMRLSPELKELWEKIAEWDEEVNGTVKIELMLADHGKRVKQQLFLYSLCMSNFSASKAMKTVCVTKKELDHWIATDAGFSELVDEIEWHKGNFFEEMLVQLVSAGNPAAVMFANKTFNAERGYARKDKLDVNVSGTVLQGVVDLTDLTKYLSDSAKLELLDALRKRETATVPVLGTREILENEIANFGEK